MHVTLGALREMVKTIVLRQDPPFHKKTGGLFMYPPPALPHLKIWCLVCIAPTLSGVETKKTIQTLLCQLFSTQASCAPNMKVSTQIFRPINVVHLANQTGGILHSPFVMTTSLTQKISIFSGCMTQDTQHKIRNAFSFVERNQKVAGRLTFESVAEIQNL